MPGAGGWMQLHGSQYSYVWSSVSRVRHCTREHQPPHSTPREKRNLPGCSPFASRNLVQNREERMGQRKPLNSCLIVSDYRSIQSFTHQARKILRGPYMVLSATCQRAGQVRNATPPRCRYLSRQRETFPQCSTHSIYSSSYSICAHQLLNAANSPRHRYQHRF